MSGKPRKKTEEDFYRDLGQAIRVARTAAGKSQEEVAVHLDRTFQQVQKYEKGKDRIPVDLLASVAAYLEVPLSQLVAPTDKDEEFQALAAQFGSLEFHALMQAWGCLKDRAARAALVNLVRCMAKLSR